jgi:hypothetical protein
VLERCGIVVGGRRIGSEHQVFCDYRPEFYTGGQLPDIDTTKSPYFTKNLRIHFISRTDRSLPNGMVMKHNMRARCPSGCGNDLRISSAITSSSILPSGVIMVNRRITYLHQ